MYINQNAYRVALDQYLSIDLSKLTIEYIIPHHFNAFHTFDFAGQIPGQLLLGYLHNNTWESLYLDDTTKIFSENSYNGIKLMIVVNDWLVWIAESPQLNYKSLTDVRDRGKQFCY